MRPPDSILVIVTRRIGDVLLATPLIRSLRLAWPAAAIDALVFAGTEGILAANPDLRRVVAVPENAKEPSHLRTLFSLARRYDLAVSTLPGDRPTFTAWLAGRRRVGLLLEGAQAFLEAPSPLPVGAFRRERYPHGPDESRAVGSARDRKA